MTRGTVKFYNGHKGFGFIQPDQGGKDVFVHATALERAGIASLQEGQKVSFDTQTDARSGKIAVGRLEVMYGPTGAEPPKSRSAATRGAAAGQCSMRFRA